MIKVNITQTIEGKFKALVLSIFQDGWLSKKENKKEIFKITLSDIDKLLKKRFQGFDENITFEKLLVADVDYLYQIKKHADSNRYKTTFTKIEKEYFYTLYSRLKKAEYIELLNISTCLYCNRNYVFNFNKSSKKEATAQLDHFFDKKSYPFLAVSLYNLIPCCATCNQRKSTKQEDIIHPFQESFDKKAKFRLKIEDSKFYYDKNSIEIKLKADGKKAQNSIEVFNLNRLYKNHKDIALELIQKQAMYNDSYIDELLKKYEGTLFKNREDLQRLVSGGYISDEEIGKRPLSKLIKDISTELGLT